MPSPRFLLLLLGALIGAATAAASEAPADSIQIIDPRDPDAPKVAYTWRPSAFTRAGDDPTYFIPLGTGRQSDLLFEANIAPDFRTRIAGTSLYFLATPRVILRMFNEESSPVRTPSYMPRVTLFWFPNKNPNRTTYLYSSLRVGHHSNGQKGQFYVDDRPNLVDGSFSTNFVELSAHVWGVPKFKNLKSPVVALISASLQVHPAGFQDDPLHGQYGYVHGILRLRAHTRERIRVDTFLNYRVVLDEVELDSRFENDDFTRHSINFGVNIDLERLENFGLFADVYWGRDYYNLQFYRTLTTFRIGLSAQEPFGF